MEDVGALGGGRGRSDNEVRRANRESYGVAGNGGLHQGGIEGQAPARDARQLPIDGLDLDVDQIAVSHEIGDVPVDRVVVQLFPCAYLLHAALTEHD
jgi:hypothetical protein